jgi:hypothetical protein
MPRQAYMSRMPPGKRLDNHAIYYTIAGSGGKNSERKVLLTTMLSPAELKAIREGKKRTGPAMCKIEDFGLGSCTRSGPSV